jgi:hypothetical protein
MNALTTPLKQFVPLLAAWLCIGGCTSTGTQIQERLDPTTGVTITFAEKPLIFYRDSSARAAYARDFVSLGPLQINRMGQYRYFMWAGIWNTMPVSHLSDEIDGFESIILFVDGEPLQLTASGWAPSAIGASESVYVRPQAAAGEAYYEVTIDQLRFIAEASDVRLQTSGPGSVSYEPWESQRSGRDSMQAFVSRIGH